MGYKQNDLFGSFGCMACHMVVDGVVQTEYGKETLELWHLQAVIRTQQIWLNEGLITAGKKQ